MVALNMLWKLYVVVALGLPSIAISTDVAQEQPRKESFLSRFFGKKDASANKLQEVPESNKTDTEENTDPDDPPKFSVEWYLLPKPENRATLRERLPREMRNAVPEDCNEPILPVVEKRIRKFFSLSEKEQCLRRAYSSD